jgi:murein DD-endopeptidase MepM/ murein hydrolase activator NlpD
VQSQIPIDTISNEYGRIVLYSDNTWAVIETVEFDGILNARIHKVMNENGNSFSYNWSNSSCFPNGGNNLSLLKDTVWLCVEGEEDDFCVPVEGIKTSKYGYRKGRYHNGVDLDLETGDTVRAAWSGKIRYATYNTGGFGNLVIIRHNNGLETFYAHLSKLLVFPNQDVKAGDVIGLGGNTGRSFGSHLHFEMRFYDACMNPEEIIDFENKRVKRENLLVHKALFRPGAKPTDEYYSPGTNSVKNTGTSTQTVQKVSQNNVKYHRIRSGDTLSGIARKYGTTVSRLCSLNGIRPTTVLHIGRSLRVR